MWIYCSEFLMAAPVAMINLWVCSRTLHYYTDIISLHQFIMWSCNSFSLFRHVTWLKRGSYVNTMMGVLASLCREPCNVIKWKNCPRYWPYVRGIHRSPVNSPHKGQWHGALMILWSALEQIVERIIETPVIWDAIKPIMSSLYCESVKPRKALVSINITTPCYRSQ